MADILTGLKKTWLKGMEVVGNAASNVATNTKQKVNEMNLESKRREILSDFGHLAYELWQKGTVLPKELSDQLEQLSRIDEELNALHAQRFKDVEGTYENAGTLVEEAEQAQAQQDEPEPAQTEDPSESTPIAEDTAQTPPEEENPKTDA